MACTLVQSDDSGTIVWLDTTSRRIALELRLRDHHRGMGIQSSTISTKMNETDARHGLLEVVRLPQNLKSSLPGCTTVTLPATTKCERLFLPID